MFVLYHRLQALGIQYPPLQRQLLVGGGGRRPDCAYLSGARL